MIPGFNISLFGQAIVAEIGNDMSKFPNERHFCSWFGLVPKNEISGGKTLKLEMKSVPIGVSDCPNLVVVFLSSKLALLVGNVLTYVAAGLPPFPTGHWDQRSRKRHP